MPTMEELLKQIKELKYENEEWRSSAKYHVMMEGPKFGGWDMSQLNRCRRDFIEKDWNNKGQKE